MSNEPGERRRRREVERARALAEEDARAQASERAGVATAPPAAGVGVPRPSGPVDAAPEGRPLTRRELRERERRAAEAGEAAEAGGETTVDPDRRQEAEDPSARWHAVDGGAGAAGTDTRRPAAPQVPRPNPPAGPRDVRTAAPAVLPAQRASSSSAPLPGPPPAPAAEALPAHPDAVVPDRDRVDAAPQRYSWRHLTVLGLVALVLGFVVWSLVEGAPQPGATGAASAPPTTSPIGPPTAHPGVL